MIRVAVAGSGRWGINHVRALAASPLAEITAVCDPSPQALDRARAYAPRARLTPRFEDLLAAPDIDAVILATPARLHAVMAESALAAGKHVLVEKPLALSAADAARTVRAAARAEKTLMVGHLMLFHPVVRRMREVIDSGELGNIHYLYALRVNLGVIRRDENAMWSLAPHDLSMILHLVDAPPDTVTARGGTYLTPDVPDVVFLNLRFTTGVVAQIQNSWLDPRKERRLTVVGSRKMMEMDDVRPEKKLHIFDRGVAPPTLDFSEYAEFLSLRNGPVDTPLIPMEEPLIAEQRHFLECILHRTPPLTGGDSALRIVQVLEAAQRSLDSDGAPVRVEGSRP
ncbi:MAG: Gfo/Idh/MocA family oxidoreductase [Polyangiaceae bacterium]